MIAVGTEKDWFITHGWKTKIDANETMVVDFNSKRYNNNERRTLKKSKEHLLHAKS
jgi:hypothetical protein